MHLPLKAPFLGQESVPPQPIPDGFAEVSEQNEDERVPSSMQENQRRQREEPRGAKNGPAASAGPEDDV